MLNVKYEKHYPGEIVKMEGLFKSKKAFTEWMMNRPEVVVIEIEKAPKRYL